MSFRFSFLPYRNTHSFSTLVNDYLSGSAALKPFYRFNTDLKAVEQAIEDRKKISLNRENLVNVLHSQYEHLTIHPSVQMNIDRLSEQNTFTVCTAHQPNLLTGYLYFIYKIVHAIKLAEELREIYPQNNFVPVYYMGSEDNDLDELGTFWYNERKYCWDGGGQGGAVGRMYTDTLHPLLEELFKELGPPGPFCDDLKDLLSRAYLQQPTIGKATQYLINELFGRFGLVVIDPDDIALKSDFIPVMEDDLFTQTPHRIVTEQIEILSEHYKAQAYPRPVNLFYIHNNLRERIEKHEEQWVVLNTEIRWSEKALREELNMHPERFSPNVILRGLFQEIILPNVVFIGGGAEVAYWLQLKRLFDHYQVFYPAIHLRQSVLWMNEKEEKLRSELGLDYSEMFRTADELIHRVVVAETNGQWQTGKEMKQLEDLLVQLKQKAVMTDPTLRSSAEAVLTKIKHQVAVLEKKMLRAEKRKLQESVLKVEKLKNRLFPGKILQERRENFLHYYLLYGTGFLDTLKEHFAPFRHEFLVLTK